MTSRDYFVVGCKVVGIYCIFLSLSYFVNAIGTFFTPSDLPPEIAQSLFVARTILRLVPIIYVLLGIYLLKDGRFIHDLAYPQVLPIEDEEENSEQRNESDTANDSVLQPPVEEDNANNLTMTDKLTLAFKFTGIYLILANFPDVLKIIENYITKTASSNYYYRIPEASMMYDKILTHLMFLPSVGGIILGIYLLRSDNLFIKLALKAPQKTDVDADESD